MATGFDWDSLAVPGGAPAQLPTSPYDEIATNVATELDLDPALVRAMMFRESAGDPNALSPKGAGGLMQLMPETAAELGVQDVYNPEQNIRGGAQYYQQLQDQFGGERWKALAAYNAGPGRMREWEAQGITDPSQIPYPETRDYVSNVQGAYDQFRTPSQPVPMPGSPALAPPPIDPTAVAQEVGLTGFDWNTLAEPPSTLQKISETAGTIGQLPGIKQFGDIMHIPKGALEEHVLQPLYGYSPETGAEDFGGYLAQGTDAAMSLLGMPEMGEQQPELGSVGVSDTTRTLVNEVTKFFGNLLTDPIVLGTAGVGSLVGGTAQAGALTARLMGPASARFISSYPTVARLLAGSNMVVGKGFQAQMALGAAQAIPAGIDQLIRDPNDQEGWANLVHGSLSAYYAGHGILAKHLRRGVGEFEHNGNNYSVFWGPGGLEGQGGKVNPRLLSVLKENPAFDLLLRGQELFIDGVYERGLAAGRYVGDKPPLVLGFGTGARGAMRKNPKTGLIEFVWDPMTHLAELSAVPAGQRGPMLRDIMTALTGHEMSHWMENYLIPHGFGPEVQGGLRNAKLAMDAKIREIQAAETLTPEQKTEAANAAMKEHQDVRNKILADFQKKVGATDEQMEQAMMQEAFFAEATKNPTEWARQVVGEKWAELEGAFEGGFERVAESMLATIEKGEAALGQSLRGEYNEPYRKGTLEELTGDPLTRKEVAMAYELDPQRFLEGPPVTPEPQVGARPDARAPDGMRVRPGEFGGLESIGALRHEKAVSPQEQQRLDRALKFLRVHREEGLREGRPRDTDALEYRYGKDLEGKGSEDIKNLLRSIMVEREGKAVPALPMPPTTPEGKRIRPEAAPEALPKEEVMKREVDFLWDALRREKNPLSVQDASVQESMRRLDAAGVTGPELQPLIDAKRGGPRRRDIDADAALDVAPQRRFEGKGPEGREYSFRNRQTGARGKEAMGQHAGGLKKNVARRVVGEMSGGRFGDFDTAVQYGRARGEMKTVFDKLPVEIQDLMSRYLSAGPLRAKEDPALLTGLKGSLKPQDLQALHSRLEAAVQARGEELETKIPAQVAKLQKTVERLEERLAAKEGVEEREGKPFFVDQAKAQEAEMPAAKNPAQESIIPLIDAEVARATEAGERPNMGKIMKSLSPEQKREGKFVKSYIQAAQKQGGGAPQPKYTPAKQAIGQARAEVEKAEAPLKRGGFTPEEWQEYLRKLPTETRPKGEEVDYTGVMEWLNDVKAEGQETVSVDQVMQHVKRHSALTKGRSRGDLWETAERRALEEGDSPEAVQLRAKKVAVEELEREISGRNTPETLNALGIADTPENRQMVEGNVTTPRDMNKFWSYAKLGAKSALQKQESAERVHKAFEPNGNFDKLHRWLNGEEVVITRKDIDNARDLTYDIYSEFQENATVHDRWRALNDAIDNVHYYAEEAMNQMKRAGELSEAEISRYWNNPDYYADFNSSEPLPRLQGKMADRLSREYGNWGPEAPDAPGLRFRKIAKELETAAQDVGELSAEKADPSRVVESMGQGVKELFGSENGRRMVAELTGKSVDDLSHYGYWKEVVNKTDLPIHKWAKDYLDKYEATPLDDRGTLMPVDTGLTEWNRAKREVAELESQLIGSNVGEGRESKWEGFNRTPGDTAFKEVEHVAEAPPYVGAKEVADMGYRLESESPRGENLFEATYTIDPDAPAPFANHPIAAFGQGKTPELARNDARQKILQARGGPEKTAPHLFQPHHWSKPTIWHSRVEGWKLDPNAERLDTYAEMERQSDIHQKTEKLTPGGPAWRERQGYMEDVSRDVYARGRAAQGKMPEALKDPSTFVNDLVDSSLIVEDARVTSGAESYRQAASRHYVDPQAYDKYVLPFLAEKGISEGDYWKALNTEGRYSDTVEMHKSWLAQKKAEIEASRQGKGADYEDLVAKSERLNLAAAHQKGYESRGPWPESWVEQNSKQNVSEAILRGFRNFFMNDTAYAKTTAGSDVLFWRQQPGSPEKFSVGVSSESFSDPPTFEGGRVRHSSDVVKVPQTGENFAMTRQPNGEWTYVSTAHPSGTPINLTKQVRQAEQVLAALRKGGVRKNEKGMVVIDKAMAKALNLHPDFNLSHFMTSAPYKAVESTLPKQDWIHLNMEGGYDIKSLKLEPTLKAMKRMMESAEANYKESQDPKLKAARDAQHETAKKNFEEATENLKKAVEAKDLQHLYFDEAGGVKRPYSGFNYEVESTIREAGMAWEKASKELDQAASPTVGGTSATQAKGFDKFISGKTLDTYKKLFRGMGHESSVEQLKQQRPDIEIIEEPQKPGDPIRVAVPVEGTHRVGWIWPNLPDGSKLPIPNKGFYASRGGFRQGDPLLDAMSKDFHGRFASLPSKEGRLWNPKEVSDLSKIDHPLWEAINAPRALITSLDLSGILRQGFPATARGLISNPQMVGKAIKDSIISMRDPAYYERAMREIEQQPDFSMLKNLGLEFAKKEEQYAGTALLGRMFKKFKIPDFPSASERGFTYYLNRLRYEAASEKAQTLRKLGFDPVNDRYIYRSAMKWANIITGRGNLPEAKTPLAQAVRASEGFLNTVMFSPRLMLSRLAMLNPYVYLRTGRAAAQKYGAMSPKVLGAMWGVHGMDMAASAALAAGTMALVKGLYGGEIEDDPRSSNFGQVRIGNARVDLTGGMRTYFTAAARTLTGKSKTQFGKIREQPRTETLGTFFRGKLSPIPGTAINLLAGKTVTGEDVYGPLGEVLRGEQELDAATAKEIFTKFIGDEKMEGLIGNLTYPMILRDIQALYKEDPALAIGLAVPLALGAGVSTHELRGGMTPGSRDIFKELMIDPMRRPSRVGTPFKDMAGRNITADVPYMLQQQIEEQVDRGIYEKIEEVSERIEDLPPIARRQALLMTLFSMYKMRRLQMMKALGPSRIRKQVQEKMVPEEWQTLGGPPISPDTLGTSPSFAAPPEPSWF